MDKNANIVAIAYIVFFWVVPICIGLFLTGLFWYLIISKAVYSGVKRALDERQ